jgi:hypothetical protein
MEGSSQVFLCYPALMAGALFVILTTGLHVFCRVAKTDGHIAVAPVEVLFLFFCADRQNCSPHALTHPQTPVLAGIASLHSRSSRHGASARVMVRPLRICRSPISHASCCSAATRPLLLLRAASLDALRLLHGAADLDAVRLRLRLLVQAVAARWRERHPSARSIRQHQQMSRTERRGCRC